MSSGRSRFWRSDVRSSRAPSHWESWRSSRGSWAGDCSSTSSTGGCCMARRSFARRSHARHHGDAHALVSTPALVIAAGALTIRVLLGLVLPSGIATLTVFGLYAGYNYFALLHHLQHHRGEMIGRVEYWRTLVALHDVHHHHARSTTASRRRSGIASSARTIRRRDAREGACLPRSPSARVSLPASVPLGPST